MFPGNPPIDSPLAWGSVGWDDRDEFYELGTTADDGNILVNVQLFRGRDMSKPLDQTMAQGQKLLCKVGSNFLTIPPKGSRVLVAIPDTIGLIPGGSVIVLCDNPNPIMIGNLQPGEAGLWGAIGAGRILVKKNGAIVLFTTSDNTSSGSSVVLYVGPDKIQIGNQYGALTLDSTGWTMTAGQAALTLTEEGDAKLVGQTASVTGSIAAIAGTVFTGIGANPAQPAAFFPLPTGPAAPSTTVYLSV